MKIRCLNCEHGYTPLYGRGCGEEVQSCDYGLRDGAAPVGEYCPMDGKKLRDVKRRRSMEIIITLKDDTKLKFNRNPEDLRKARLNKEIILLFAGLYMFSGQIRRRPDPDEDTFIIYPNEGPIGGECRFTDVLSWCYAPKTLKQKGGCACQ